MGMARYAQDFDTDHVSVPPRREPVVDTLEGPGNYSPPLAGTPEDPRFNVSLEAQRRRKKALTINVDVGQQVLYGRWKNHRGKIVGFKNDKHGFPVAIIEPIPKGRKQNKEIGLLKFWPDKTTVTAGAAKPGSAGQVKVIHKNFDIWYLPKYEEYLPVVQAGLDKTLALYAQAGYKLPHNIPVLMAARAFGSQRSFYTSEAGGFIQFVPAVFRDRDGLETFIHEVAHYLHAHSMPSGLSNPDIKTTFRMLKELGDEDTGGNAVETIDDQIKAVEKEFSVVGKKLRVGQVYQVRHQAMFGTTFTYRDARLIQKKGAGRRLMLVFEFLSPVGDEARYGIRGTTLPLSSFIFELQHPIPGVSDVYLELNRRYNELIDAKNQAVDNQEVNVGSRYENFRSTWFPTDYSKKNSMEWFAELVTARLFHASKMDPEVLEWLDAMVKHGGRPPSPARVAKRYFRR